MFPHLLFGACLRGVGTPPRTGRRNRKRWYNGGVTLNAQDPLTIFFIVLLAAVVVVGIYFALREVIADAILLADKKREVQKHQERNKRP